MWGKISLTGDTSTCNCPKIEGPSLLWSHLEQMATDAVGLGAAADVFEVCFFLEGEQTLDISGF